VEVELRFDAENVLSTLEGNVLTSAIFAGFEDDRLFIVTARITCGGKDKSEVRFLITDINHDPRAIFLGKDEIMQEFVAAQTERARAWNREAETQARVAGDQIAFYSIRFVQLSIQYDLGTILNGNTVHDLGGPIDVVRLRQGKGIDWIQRKPNCPAD